MKRRGFSDQFLGGLVGLERSRSLVLGCYFSLSAYVVHFLLLGHLPSSHSSVFFLARTLPFA